MSSKLDNDRNGDGVEDALLAALLRRRRRPSRAEAFFITVLAIAGTAFLAFNLYASVRQIFG